jgi:hypothetical protein
MDPCGANPDLPEEPLTPSERGSARRVASEAGTKVSPMGEVVFLRVVPKAATPAAVNLILGTQRVQQVRQVQKVQVHPSRLFLQVLPWLPVHPSLPSILAHPCRLSDLGSRLVQEDLVGLARPEWASVKPLLRVRELEPPRYQPFVARLQSTLRSRPQPIWKATNRRALKLHARAPGA